MTHLKWSHAFKEMISQADVFHHIYKMYLYFSQLFYHPRYGYNLGS